MARRKVTEADTRRAELRDQLWPGSERWIWSIHNEKIVGFATMSRLTPWICSLMRDLSGGKDPTSAFLELWCKDWGQGIISINDEQECAFASGYSGNRAVRTWKERMFKLVELGFIVVKQVGNREYGEVLLVNPVSVCARLHAQGRVPEAWWASFVKRAGEIKARIPKNPRLPGDKPTEEGP